jgi:glutamate synthase (NADPH/NADH) small chain
MPRPGVALPYALKMMLQKPATVLYPYEGKEVPKGLRGKLEFDVDKCTGCTLCSQVCPTGTIEMVDRDPEKEDKRIERLEKAGAEKIRRIKKRPDFYLFRCCYCQMCADVCPAGAIHLSEEYNLAQVDKNNLVDLQENE